MLEILRMLEQDGRLTPEQLAERSGQPVDEVRRMITAAEQQGIIRRYKAVIDWGKVEDQRMTTAFIHVKVTPQRDLGFDAIAERIKRFSEVRSLYLLSGNYDFHAVVVGKDLHDISTFVTTKLAPMEGVLSTTTLFVLKGYKIDGDIMDDADTPERLPYSI